MTVWRWFLGLPFKFLALMVLVLYVVGEEYPFSPFPMYDRFDNRAFYVYVTDARGEPIATQPVFGHRTSELKKMYDSQLRKAKAELEAAGHRRVLLARLPEEKKREAAETTLRWAKDSAKDAEAVAKLGRIQLHAVELELRDGRVDAETTLLGEL